MAKSKIFLIIVLTTLLCVCTALVWRYGFGHYYQYSFKKLDHIFADTTSDDILLLGNSFTFYGINPRPIDSVTGMKTYNVGLGGAEIAEMKFLLDSYIKHHPAPQYLVLQIHTSSLIESDLNNLLVYLFHKKANVTDELLKANNLDPIGFRRLVPFYKFFYMDDFNRTNSLKGLLGINQGGKMAKFYSGFLKMKSSVDKIPNFFELKAVRKNRDSTFIKGRKTLSEISKTCSDHNIKLIIVYPPLPFSMENNEILSDEIHSQIAKAIPDRNYILLDYSTNKILHSPQYFVDNTHLNHTGITLFSEQLAMDLKNIMWN